MKKALVLVAILAVAAFTTFAAGLSGEFSSTITVDPLACADCYNDYAFLTLSATLKVNYVLDDWTFGAVSTFDDAGFASQKFSVAGVLGAFTLASSMAFDPMAVTEWTYPTIIQTSSEMCAVWCPEATAWGPEFLTWDVTAGVSIAGITVEAYVLQDYSYWEVENVNFAVALDSPLEQTSSYSCVSGVEGMGWRLKVGGSFGSVKVTSYTYFNLVEYDYELLMAVLGVGVYCPSLAKSGYFEIANAGCDFTFVEEYLLLEGFTFGCAEIDIALKISCLGFESAEFLISNISIGGWMTMDFMLTFTTDSKDFDFCISLDPLAVDCFIVELGFGSTDFVTGTTISEIQIHGFGFEYTWNGITFKSYTEFDKYSTLMSSATKYSYLSGCDVNGYWIPFVGADCGTLVCDDESPETCCKTTVYECIDLDEGFEQLKCVATERYELWEKFVIDVDADACCGGLFDLTIGTFFGDYQVLDWVGYAVYDAEAETTTETAILGVIPATKWATWPTKAPATGCDAVTFGYDYKAGTQLTLFNWAKTEVDLGVGIASNITLTLGFDISAFGWEELKFGFKWTF